MSMLGSSTHWFRPQGRELDLICFSHLRWNFVFQRPQHLLTRCALGRRVFFFEEPMFDAEMPRLDCTADVSGVIVAVPHLPPSLSPAQVIDAQRALVDGLIAAEGI